MNRRGTDRQARQGAALEGRHQLVEARILGNADDFGARDADVVHPQAPHVAQVDQHLARVALDPGMAGTGVAVLIFVRWIAPEQARKEGCRLSRTVGVTVFGGLEPSRSVPVGIVAHVS
jgi:hypothetical protein